MGSASDLRPRRFNVPFARKPTWSAGLAFRRGGRGGMCEYPLGNPRLRGRPELARHGGIRPETSRNALPGGCAELEWARVRARNGDVKRVCPEKSPHRNRPVKSVSKGLRILAPALSTHLIWIKHGRRSSAILALRNGRFVAAVMQETAISYLVVIALPKRGEA